MEIFLPFEENGYYEVNSDGVVRNSHSGLCLKNYLDQNGRVCVKLNGGGEVRTCSVARAVYHAHVDPNVSMDDVQIRYADGDKTNVSASNLIAVKSTHAINYRPRRTGKATRVMRISDGRVFDSIGEAAVASGMHRSNVYRDLYKGGVRFKFVV